MGKELYLLLHMPLSPKVSEMTSSRRQKMIIYILVDHNENAVIPVYYLPMGIVAAKCIFPCLLPSHRFIPDIFEKENIDIGWV